MRGIYSNKTEIRHKVFTEIARMAYDDSPLSRIEDLPYEIVPGEIGKYYDNIFLERAIVVEPERKEQLDRYADELKYNAMINDPSRVDITISRKLYEEENLTSIKTRVPNTYGDNVRYLWLDKSDVVSINGGKTFFAYLNKDKEYELVDRDGQVAEKLSGQNLQKQHYDSVDVNVKNRALQEQRRGKSERKQKAKKVGTPGPKVRKTESVKGTPRGR